MERDLGMDPSTDDSVPVEKVKQLLLEIDNWKVHSHNRVMNAPCSDVHAAFTNVVFVSAGLKGVDNIVAFTLARSSRRKDRYSFS
jgi:hypothetical protein